MRIASFVLAVAAVVVPMQQAPPAPEVFLAAIENGGATLRSGWINISNNPGYDNQPSFLPDSSAILFSSNRDGKQMDIYRYDIATKAVKQLTSTPDGEYSPTVTPDRKTFSVIRQAATDQTQLLVRYDLATGAHHSVVFENVKPVGYHAWIDATHVAMFILGSGQGQPATLQIGDTKTGIAEVAETGIGRSVLSRPMTGTVSYITSGQSRMIKEYDPKSKTSKDLLAPLEGSQDAAWSVLGGTLFMARRSEIYQAKFEKQGLTAWAPFANLGTDPATGEGVRVSNITRMALSPNGRWLAFVAEPAAK